MNLWYGFGRLSRRSLGLSFTRRLAEKEVIIGSPPILLHIASALFQLHL